MRSQRIGQGFESLRLHQTGRAPGCAPCPFPRTTPCRRAAPAGRMPRLHGHGAEAARNAVRVWHRGCAGTAPGLRGMRCGYGIEAARARCRGCAECGAGMASRLRGHGAEAVRNAVRVWHRGCTGTAPRLRGMRCGYGIEAARARCRGSAECGAGMAPSETVKFYKET